jgi:uncharacterized phage protein (TIGR02220 family)
MSENVHRLPDPARMRGIDKNGEPAEWMPKTLPEAYDQIHGLSQRVAYLEGQLTRAKREDARREATRAQAAQIMEVLSHWRDRCAKKPDLVKLVADSPRWRKVKVRLEEGWTVEDLKHVVDYCVTDEFLNGSNPKTKGKTYLDATTLFRDADQVTARLGQWEDMIDRRALELSTPAMREAIDAEKNLVALSEKFKEKLGPIYLRPSELKGGRGA